MSIKKKFFVGALVAAFALAFGTADAAYMHTVTLKQGSSGAQVMALQQTLNQTSCKVSVAGAGAPGMETTTFGPKTKAAVMCFQASNGLVADGIVGPMTGAKLAMVMGGSTPTTPAPCPVGYVCTPTGGNTGNTGGLSGGAGSIEDADFISSISNEDVGEGQEDVEVLGMDIEADSGSDIQLLAVEVEFEDQNSSGSEDLDDFVEEVTIWLGGNQVGSADIDDFDDTSGVWSETINLSNAIINAGDSEELVVAVSALSNIDSSDMTANDWRVGIQSVRFRDAQGAVITESTEGDIGSDLASNTNETRDFQFTDILTAAEVELQVSTSTDNPDAGTVQVDEDGGDEVVLLVGEFEAEGADIEITELLATVTPSGTGDASEIASEYLLRVDGEEVASIDSNDCETAGDCDGSGTNTAVVYTFDDLDITVDEGDTVEFEIVAVLNEFAATFVAGDSLTASVNSDYIEAEAEGEDLTTSELSGTASGDEISFISSGATVSGFESDHDTTVDTNGGVVSATWTIEFDVSAFDQDVYIPMTVNRGSATSTGITYQVEDTSNNAVAAGDASASTAFTSSADDDGTYFIVEEGTSESFTFTVTVDDADSTTDTDVPGFVRIQLLELNYNDTAAAADSQFDFTPANDFDTAVVNITVDED